MRMERPCSLNWVRMRGRDPVSTSKAPVVVSWTDRFGQQHSAQASKWILAYGRHTSVFFLFSNDMKTMSIKHDYASVSSTSTIISSYSIPLHCVYVPSTRGIRGNATSLSTNNSQRLIRCMHYSERVCFYSTPPSRHYLKYAQAQTKIIAGRDYIYFPAARYRRDMSQ